MLSDGGDTAHRPLVVEAELHLSNVLLQELRRRLDSFIGALASAACAASAIADEDRKQWQSTSSLVDLRPATVLARLAA
jgi:hypothetical protein